MNKNKLSQCDVTPIFYGPLLKCDDLLDLNEVTQSFIRHIQGLEEDLLKRILRMLLKREPGLSDAAKLTKVYRKDISFNDYDLFYEKTHIGRVTFVQNGPNFEVNFTPDKKYL